MQIVIEIDEARFKDIQRIAEVQLKSNYFQTAEQIIAKGVPTEQEPKTGHWIKTPKAVMGEGYMWYCDKCEHEVYQDSSRPYPSEKYCPNCGTKMLEPQESEEA